MLSSVLLELQISEQLHSYIDQQECLVLSLVLVLLKLKHHCMKCRF